jgi:hypothetical protein
MNKRGKSLIIIGLILILSALILTPFILSTQTNFSTICYNEKHSIINHEITCEVQNNLPVLSDHEFAINLNLQKGNTKDVEIFEFVEKSKQVPEYKTVCNPYEEQANETTYTNQNCTQIQTGTKTVSYETLEKLAPSPNAEKTRWSVGQLQFKSNEKRKLLIKWKTSVEQSKNGWGSSGNWEINPGGWWNNSWTRRREIKIQENSGDALTNYSVKLSITYDSDMQADFDDLRFSDSTGDTELNYWIENKSDSNWAIVWVKVPALTASSNTSIYIYYNYSLHDIYCIFDCDF